MKHSLLEIPPDLMEFAAEYRNCRLRDLDTLKDALNRKDYERIAQLSHKTKGTAGSYGFAGLGDLADQLERAVKDGIFGQIEMFLREMETYLNEVEIPGFPADPSPTRKV